MSWCLAANGDLDLGAALSTHASATRPAPWPTPSWHSATRISWSRPQFPNMSALVMNLYYPQLPVGRGLTAGLTTEELDAVDACLDGARAAALRARPDRSDAGLLVDEVLFSIDLVSLLTDDARARLQGDGSLGSVAAQERAGLGTRLDALVERYRGRWHDRNRPGGLNDSLSWLHNLQAAYASGRPDPRWGGLRPPTGA